MKTRGEKKLSILNSMKTHMSLKLQLFKLSKYCVSIADPRSVMGKNPETDPEWEKIRIWDKHLDPQHSATGHYTGTILNTF